MAIDVVVVNYRTPDLLKDFIQSYWEHAWDGCTLTVVEVEPDTLPMAFHVQDGLHDVLGQYGPLNGFVKFDENVGYARACNAGAKGGPNDVILLANADTLLTDGLITCYNALNSWEDWGILGPRQVNMQGVITAGGILGPVHSPRQRGWNEPDMGQYSDILDDVYSVSGSLYFIKRKVWEELRDCEVMQALYPDIEGAFIPTPHYFEETTCSRHAVAHGYRCVYYGPVQMVHHWHAASPHGGWADQQFNTSLIMHRNFCDAHDIEHE